MHVPRATYRLQFNEHFRLSHALALVPYLHELGISHLYASPLFKATPHSSHGYDVCDYNQLNPELGTEADLEKLVVALHKKHMGLVIDIVPNHMGVGSPANAWWWDVLKHGRKSEFAEHFDIIWTSSDEHLDGKVLVPILAGDYENHLAKGDLQFVYENGSFALSYGPQRFPVAPETLPTLTDAVAELSKINANASILDHLIRRQNYRLEYHGHGDAKLNYRRFFAVSSLAAVRVEDEKVFQKTHALIRRWVEKGWIDGLRVDHPDGLREPENYLHQLRALAPEAWIVVEKILEPDEALPATWPVAGTTGYDFLNQLNGIFVAGHHENAFTEFYSQFTGETTEYAKLVREKKRLGLTTLLAAELTRLTGLLLTVAARRPSAKKLSRAELGEALKEILTCFPVYRTYFVEGKKLSPADIAAIQAAVRQAGEERTDVSPDAFAFIQSLLLKPPRGQATLQFVMRFQQVTGAVMAKGVEDTAFYCFNRFASLNEVGGDPNEFGITPDAFHQFLQRQQSAWPQTQLTTSTHDTKRAEDVRARLNVLSEKPEVWSQTVRRWSAMNACHRQKKLPDRNAEYLYYQMLVGAWPISVDRAQFYMEKAVNESRQHTNWSQRNKIYEDTLQNFISESLHDPEFTADLERFTSEMANAAATNSLAQTLIKLTAPGIPDMYQGCELWDFSLVDPDNRRPVDFDLRQRLLEHCNILSAEKVWAGRAEGLPKLWLIRKTLQRRAQIVDFISLNYRPLIARGAKADHIFAFARGNTLITAIPRFLSELKNDWGHTTLELPPGEWLNEFTGEIFNDQIPAQNLFQGFPVALLVKKENH